MLLVCGCVRNVSIEQIDICGSPEEFTEDEAKLIAAVKEAICDEKLSAFNDDARFISTSTQSSLSETLLPIAEGTSISANSVSDITKGA